jgi:hypothetical protein
MNKKSILMRIDPSLKTVIDLTRKRAELNYKLTYKTDRKFSNREISKILAVKILHDSWRMPIESVMLIINGQKGR